MTSWRRSPTGLAVRLYVLLVVLALLATSKASVTVFVTSVIIVAVVSVFFAVAVVKLRRYFKQYPMDSSPTND